MKWYTWTKDYVWRELSTITHLTYNMSEHSHTLTINDLRETAANYYCCEDEEPVICWETEIKLIVSDLQVKVFPTTEGQTVTLMCSTSCPLTEKPAAYIWYKNREFLYEDWSPWYQELVSSEEAVRYSCAIKGYEDLRAPEVSVDSVTDTCFTVTYAGGRMCSYTQTSVDESCSITHPADLQVKVFPTTEGQTVTLMCSTSCPLTEKPAAYIWYKNREFLYEDWSPWYQELVSSEEAVRYSCAIKGYEDLRAPEVSVDSVTETCFTVTYAGGRMCSYTQTSVNESCSITHPAGVARSCWSVNMSGGESVLCKAPQSTSLVNTHIHTDHCQNHGIEQKYELNPDPMYENVSAQAAEQDDHQYSRLHFPKNHTADLYSTIRPLPSDQDNKGLESVTSESD
ncbi:uncharacterized protein LOC114427574 [Parambassis ranga]|uniref:Uncharacterized protein LOC114427574 n=1 Tax=Parambassis ranga TaxID=210632 RepID=A0A6P7HI45_9TELE|nr:uncharacterized protein LOC114427574 [Parambassis ranga]